MRYKTILFFALTYVSLLHAQVPSQSVTKINARQDTAVVAGRSGIWAGDSSATLIVYKTLRVKIIQGVNDTTLVFPGDVAFQGSVSGVATSTTYLDQDTLVSESSIVNFIGDAVTAVQNGDTLDVTISGSGDITSVIAGDGLSGGAASGDATLIVNVHPDSALFLTNDSLALRFDGVTLGLSDGKLTVLSVSGVTGADEDDVTLADVQAAASNDFHNIGGTDAVSDTTTLKLIAADSLGEARYLVSLSSTNNKGGGWFIWADSLNYSTGAVQFDSPTTGKEWVRADFYEDRTFLNVEWFGALADGATDDAPIFNQVHDFASAGMTVFLPYDSDGYVVNTLINDTKGLNWVGDGTNKTLLLCNLNGTAFRAEGDSSGTSTTLSDTLILNQEKMLLTSTSGFDVGNLAIVISDSAWYHKATLKKGEFHKISKVDGDTLFIEGHTWDNYAVGPETVDVYEIIPIQGSLKNLEFRFTESATYVSGVQVAYALDYLVDNVKVSLAGNDALRFEGCYNSTVQNSVFTQANRIDGGGGFIDLSSFGTTIVGCYTYECNTGIDCGVVSNTGVPTRGFRILNNTIQGGGIARPDSIPIWNAIDYGIATHEGAESITISGNHINNVRLGVVVTGDRVDVIDNKFTGRMESMVLPNNGGQCTISGNEYRAGWAYRDNLLSTPSTRLQGLNNFIEISNGFTDHSDTTTALHITNNTVWGLTAFSASAPAAIFKTSTEPSNMVMTGNDFVVQCESASDSVHFFNTNGNARTLRNVYIKDNPIKVITGAFSVSESNDVTVESDSVTFEYGAQYWGLSRSEVLDNYTIRSTQPNFLHLKKGDWGGSAYDVDSHLLLENNSDFFIQFLGPNTIQQGLYFSNPVNGIDGQVSYRHSTRKLTLQAGGVANFVMESDSVVTLGSVRAGGTISADSVIVIDDAYSAGWNGLTTVPTKNALYDKIEDVAKWSDLPSGGGLVPTASTDTTIVVRNAASTDSIIIRMMPNGEVQNISTLKHSFTGNLEITNQIGDSTIAESPTLIQTGGPSTKGVVVKGTSYFSPAEDLWVAVGRGTNSIAYSSDGINWTGIGTSIFSNQGRGVAWNGNQWVAVGEGANSIAYSSDGINWTGIGTSIFSNYGQGVAWNGNQWVAVGRGTNSIAYSSDGINWTGIGTSIFSDQGLGVAWNGNQWIAVGGGTNSIAYSSDGINWTGIGTSIFSDYGQGVAWNGNQWIAVGVGTNSIAYSSDGINWTGIGTSIFSSYGRGVAWNGNQWIAVGGGTNSIAYSSDGINWTGIGTSIFSNYGREVASAPGPEMYPSVGQLGSTETVQSANLQEWQNKDGAALSVIDGSGNLGVRNSDPDGYLEIGNNYFLVETSGEIGVGTSSPDQPLEVNLGTSGTIRGSYNDSNGSALHHFDFSIASDGDMNIEATGDRMNFNLPGGTYWYMAPTGIFPGSGGKPWWRYLNTDETTPNMGSNVDDLNTGLGSAGPDTLNTIAGGVNAIQITKTGVQIDTALNVGSGSFQGPGSINGDSVFVNNVKVHPGFVFEEEYVEAMLGIQEELIFAMEHKKLSTMGEETKKTVNLLEWNRQQLQALERLYIYVGQLEKRISELEQERGTK